MTRKITKKSAKKIAAVLAAAAIGRRAGPALLAAGGESGDHQHGSQYQRQNALCGLVHVGFRPFC